MSSRGLLRFASAVLCFVLLLAAPSVFATGGASGAGAHPEIDDLPTLLADLGSGKLDIDDLRALGLSVFATPFNVHDGLGDGPYDPSEPDTVSFGHRPSLQGNGVFLRVNGLDAQSCNECHTIVSNASRVPTLGFGGVGGAVQNAIIMPTMIDVADSADDRTVYAPGHDPDLQLIEDGAADFNGRFANPPFLFGGGGVELIAKEMTADLQNDLEKARQAPAGAVVDLVTHGVSFGHLTSLGGGDVDLSGVEGIGPEDTTGADPEDVLVVRPFGRKGENFSMRDFDRGAMQFHFGIQPVEVIGADLDEDGDGLDNEVTVAEMSVLHIFDVTNPRPIRRGFNQQARRGREVFRNLGCSSCHVETIRTRSRKIPLAFPEIASRPFDNVYLEIDLAEHAGFRRRGPGIAVPLFSDLKRHAMGPRLAETFEGGEIANDEFITARLWGIADTAPYLHDGRASTLYEAIEFHGGEAQAVRDAFIASSEGDQNDLLAFLGTLRTPSRPNEELIELLDSH